MNENIVKIICIVLGLIVSFIFVPVLINMFKIGLTIIVGVSISILFFNVYKKYIQK
jgi:flagellar biosynthesis component FlhA